MKLRKRIAVAVALVLALAVLASCGTMSGVRQRFEENGWKVDGNGYLGLKEVGSVRVFVVLKEYADPSSNKIALILELTAGDDIEEYIKHLETEATVTEEEREILKGYLDQAKAAELIKKNCLLVPLQNADDAVALFREQEA